MHRTIIEVDSVNHIRRQRHIQLVQLPERRALAASRYDGVRVRMRSVDLESDLQGA